MSHSSLWKRTLSTENVESNGISRGGTCSGTGRCKGGGAGGILVSSVFLLLLLFFFSFSMPFINKSKSSLAYFMKKEYLGVTLHGYVGRVKLHGWQFFSKALLWAIKLNKLGMFYAPESSLIIIFINERFVLPEHSWREYLYHQSLSTLITNELWNTVLSTTVNSL